MVRKAPRRTAERILETTLALFNRFGEPNVSTTVISAELGISPGNLYYHYPTKDALINALFDRFEASLSELLAAAPAVRHVEDAWLFVHLLFEQIWAYRFLYRDLNDLLSQNRHLETHFQQLLTRQIQALKALLTGLRGATPSGVEAADTRTTETDDDALAISLSVVLTYWLSHAYARAPRLALEPAQAEATLARGAWQVLCLISPLLPVAERQHLRQLAGAYQQTANASVPSL